jgi:FkbM family methyltransferase
MIKNYLNIAKAIIMECRNWPFIIFAKIFDLKLENIVLNNGVKIFMGGKIGKADLSMFSEIWHNKFYNPEGFEINKNDIVFDIGANNGFFSVYAAEKAVNGKVYAFEPVPYLADKIRKTASLNNFKNIIVENLAIGKGTDSKHVFYISKEHNGCHSLYERKGQLEKIEVSVTNLEKYCKDNNVSEIDFLKLDCEGAEYEIITKESVDLIKNKIKIISMEHHDDITGHTHSEIVEILQNAGFLIKVSDGFVYAKNGNKDLTLK